MLFSEVIGLATVKKQLAEMVQQNRLSHALLFLGKEGSGALPLAMAFAQYLVSLPKASPKAVDLFGDMTALAPSPAFIHPDAIAQEESFGRASQLMHPDLHFSYPVISKKPGEKPISADYIQEWREFILKFPHGNIFDWLQFIGAENKQGNITADECKEINKQISLKSFESNFKILLLWMPEYLTKEGNKLLKLIEEPPPNTIFLLVAENDEKILPTILSRCQLIKIPMPQDDEIAEALVNKANLTPEKAGQIAGIVEGNYREALQLIQHAEWDLQTLLREWLNATLKGGPIAQIKFAEDISKLGRERQKQFLRYFNHLLEQAIRIKVLGLDRIQLPDEEKDFAQRLNKISSVSQQKIIIEELDKASYYIERNANPKILFQAITIKLYHIIQNKTLFLVN